MGVQDTFVLANAFLEAYAAVYGVRQARDRCAELQRCVYDDLCPLIGTCTPTEYSE